MIELTNYLNERKYEFLLFTEMNIKTFSDKRDMSYNHYIKLPTHAVERRLNLIISRQPELINALDRNVCHPLIRKYSHTPFKK